VFSAPSSRRNLDGWLRGREGEIAVRRRAAAGFDDYDIEDSEKLFDGGFDFVGTCGNDLGRSCRGSYAARSLVRMVSYIRPVVSCCRGKSLAWCEMKPL